jgi:hypothetical protein
MISGFAGKIANVFSSAPQATGAQAERAVAQNGAGNLSARDTMAKKEQGKRAAQAISATRGQQKLMALQKAVGQKKKA